MLTWRHGEHHDRAALQQFLCTPPVKGRRFGRGAPPRSNAWELEAQSAIRNLRPPAVPSALIVLGSDEGGIAAVAAAEQDATPDVVFVSLIGVALRLRHRSDGIHVGEELTDQVINWAAERADANGYSRLTLWGYVHLRNVACQSLCRRIGADTFEGTGAFDRWVANIVIE